MKSEPAIYSWFLHRELLDALFDESSRTSISRMVRRTRTRSDHITWTRELERWLSLHRVEPLETAVLQGSLRRGQVVWTELAFEWSDVTAERRSAMAGHNTRSSFSASLTTRADEVTHVHGTFNPHRLTCSTANSELRGTRTQYMLGHVARCSPGEVELRPMVIGARLLSVAGQWPTGSSDLQRIPVESVEQFARVDWDTTCTHAELELLRAVPETTVKTALATILSEPVVPKDWGGEQSDLWTTRMRIDGRAHTAAFLLKGPAKFAPMTIGMLGKNGDQLERLSRTSAEVLVIQHCHEIRPEVVSMLETFSSDFRNVRRYMVIDGFDTYAILHAYGYL